VYAILGTAADDAVQLRINLNGQEYCTLMFQPGNFVSDSVDGFTLPVLAAGSHITLSVLAVGQVYPGADLTVLIRL
jgi:hypothetical protein